MSNYVIDKFIDDLFNDLEGDAWLEGNQYFYLDKAVSLPVARNQTLNTRLHPDFHGVNAALTQWLVIANIYRTLRRWFRVQVRVDMPRGRGASPTLRPDLQFYNQNRQRTTRVEVDTDPSRMRRHIQSADNTRRNVFILINPRDGSVIERNIMPANSRTVTRLTGVIQQTDFFDA